MKSNAPWSVKGIERDARETAKSAAKREGMTVGEWLNQMIYAAGDPTASGGEVDGLKLSDVVTAVDHLHKRIADTSDDSAQTINDFSRKMGEVVERVQRLERSEPEGGDRERVGALKALEKAVAQVAVQFSTAQQSTVERLDASEKTLQALTERLEADAPTDNAEIGALKATIEELQTKLESGSESAAPASEGDAAFVANTSNRLRVLGDEIKRGGDQIRALEAGIEKLSGKIEAAERRSAEGIQKTAETLTALRESLSGDADSASVNKNDIADIVANEVRATAERVDTLQHSFETMIDQLSALNAAQSRGDTAGAGNESAAPKTPLPGLIDDMELLDGDEPREQASAEAQSETEATAFDTPTSVHAKESEATPAEKPQSDDEFFSFADDIDASIDDLSAAEREDGFSFELNDAPEAHTETQSGAFDDEEIEDDGSADESAFASLAPFSSESPAPAQPDTAPVATTNIDIETDLEELLAGLGESDAPEEQERDELGAAAPTEEEDPLAAMDPPDADDPFFEDTPPPFAEQTPAPEPAADPAPIAAAPSAPEQPARPTRRDLTPKQKAILAARARRKRLSAAGAAPTSQDAGKLEAAKQATRRALAGEAPEAPIERPQRPSVEEDENSDAPQGPLAALMQMIPFIGAKKDSDDSDQDGETGGEKLDLLKNASSRTVMIALGVGVALVAGVTFIAAGSLSTPAQNDASSSTVATDAGASTPAPTLEAPAAPPTDPTILYRDAITGLNAAGNDAEKAIAMEKLEQAALLGHPPAQLQLGELYKTGQGVELDLTRARSWFERSANGGNVLAMHRIGIMTARGEGGSANIPEAINWFEKAANRGLVDSQYNLGAIYHPSDDAGGANSLQDAGKAYYWYSLAVLNGDEQARPLAESLVRNLSSSQRTEIDQSLASWSALPTDEEANTLANG